MDDHPVYTQALALLREATSSFEFKAGRPPPQTKEATCALDHLLSTYVTETIRPAQKQRFDEILTAISAVSRLLKSRMDLKNPAPVFPSYYCSHCLDTQGVEVYNCDAHMHVDNDE